MEIFLQIGAGITDEMRMQSFCTILLFNILGVWIDMPILTNLLLWWGAGQYWNAI